MLSGIIKNIHSVDKVSPFVNDINMNFHLFLILFRSDLTSCDCRYYMFTKCCYILVCVFMYSYYLFEKTLLICYELKKKAGGGGILNISISLLSNSKLNQKTYIFSSN